MLTFAALIMSIVVSEYIQKLNDAQREAVVNFRCPSLIVAGAGSGKTRVLTCRIAYMLEQGVAPDTILALTFTNKAAAEMRERIGQLLSPQATRRIWMGTFHSLFSRILRAEADKLGYTSSYTIYDASDARNLVKQIIREMNLSDETYKPGDIAARISLAKNNLITPGAYEANASLQAEDRERRRPQFVDIYKLYVQKCRQNGAMDFDDLLLNTNILFKDFPDVLARYQAQFRYILVDEYQDTNFAQYVIIRRLAEQHSNVCVVGDDAQSIYSFRGAKIENILRFRNDFPDARIFKLEQNYRSTQTIVDAANSIIEKNTKQIRKRSFSTAEQGEKIKVIKAYTDKEEAILIAGDIASTVREKDLSYSEIAILYRTNAQSRSLEESLRGRNIPYKIYGGVSFYQRKEIKDLLAYVRLVVNPKDDEAFRRVINTPARGIGDVTVNRIAAAAAERNLSLWEAVSTLSSDDMEMKGAAGKKVTAFAGMIGELSGMRATAEAYELGLEIAVRSGIIGTYKMQQTPEAVSALENIEELINSVRAYTDEQKRIAAESGDDAQARVTLDEWLQNVALLTDMDNEKPEERNKVTMMTVHGAKGLEFEYVYVAGLEENLFPSMMSLGNEEGLEEERRLFYVALTRAKRGAVLSFAESRFKWGEMTFCRPSRFLGEIDPKFLDIQFDADDLSAPEGGNDAPVRTAYGGRGGYRKQEAGRKDYTGNARTYYSGREQSRGERSSERPAQGGFRHAAASVREMSPVVPDSRFRSVGSRPQVEPEQRIPSAPRPAESAGAGDEFEVGMLVRHDKFGTGRVTQVEEWSGDVKITVEFDGAGRKTLLRRFAKLTPLRRG